MQALVEISGKQFIAEKDMTIKVPTQSVNQGDKITFDKVLYVSNNKEKVFGNPYVDKASVEAEVVSHGRDKKVIVFKFKRRKGYQRKQGHRQNFTTIKINNISQV
ncbi:MAG: 50S ribosomal protein L21 [Candidatus Marinimicrobia bacterium]|nr:50S ribosomal protein L21 [Candidatus Neomarinimicrobiota bacterium]